MSGHRSGPLRLVAALLAAAGLALSAPSCGGGSAGCEVATKRACTCEWGAGGSQLCMPGGTWGWCNCGPEPRDATGTPDPGPGPDLPPGTDVPRVDTPPDDVPSDAPGTDSAGPCTPSNLQARKGCGADGNIHWFDDCGAAGALIRECTGGEACLEIPDDTTCGDYCAALPCWTPEPTGQGTCSDIAQEIPCPAFPCNEDGSPDWCGQDAQYPGTARTLSCRDAAGVPQDPCDEQADSGETVVDSLTGLQWQRTFNDAKSWQEAREYCDGLTYAGLDDWRLPSWHELAGLADHGRYQPAIDPVAFPGTAPAPFWTATAAVPEGGLTWAVDFTRGTVADRLRTEDQNVRCVRGAPVHGTSPGRFAVSGTDAEPKVLDRATGLAWQGRPFTARPWKDALEYCEWLTWAGHADWRLPDVAELRSLVDPARTAPATGLPGLPAFGGPPEESRFWASTTVMRHYDLDSYTYQEMWQHRAWVVDLGTGRVDLDAKPWERRGLCVRTAP